MEGGRVNTHTQKESKANKEDKWGGAKDTHAINGKLTRSIINGTD